MQVLPDKILSKFVPENSFSHIFINLGAYILLEVNCVSLCDGLPGSGLPTLDAMLVHFNITV